MSPTPARTSLAAIVAAASQILEDDGLDAVSMAAVASRVGVRPPSLYKHVRDRDELLILVLSDTADSLARALAAIDAPGAGHDPGERLRAIAREYRSFAAERPRASALLFAGLGPDLALPEARLALAAGPVVAAAGDLVGEDAALPAARALTAFVHGFTTMEHARAFRLGGDPTEAFDLGLDALIAGLKRPTR
jgi:AcrR family transcriptional regulator